MSDKKAEKSAKPAEQERVFVAFPEAAVVRVMKKHMDKEKMIKKEVKVSMNKWLEQMCAQVSKNMNNYPYVMMTLSEFRQGKKIYDTLEEFDSEKQRILSHFDAIKRDIERLEKDLGKVEEEVMEMS